MKLLKLENAAQDLAVSVATVRRLIHDGEIFAMKIRGGLRVDAESVKRYVRKQGEIYSIENAICFSGDSRR